MCTANILFVPDASNSPDERTNFSVVPSEHTAALTVLCRDGGVASRLEPRGFASLEHLAKLTLDGCRLEEIPDGAFWGLTKLRTLKVCTVKAKLTNAFETTSISIADSDKEWVPPEGVEQCLPGTRVFGGA